MIRAVTFDFWDTLVVDDSDEPRRATQGLASKADTRRQLLTAEIQRYYPAVAGERVVEALAFANERFAHYWQNLHITLTVAARLSQVYTWLGLDLTPGFHELVHAVEYMEVEIAPDWAPSVQETLPLLAQNYKLGIISDTVHTPGRGLRQILRQAQLLSHFTYSVFSDEAGSSKPSPTVFQEAAAGLDVSHNEVVHVGDRETHDVFGALAMGMKAVLFTAVVDRGSTGTRATAVCDRFSALLTVLQELEGEASDN